MKRLRALFKKPSPAPQALNDVDAYELLSNSLPYGVSLIDPDLNVIRSNLRMREWFPKLNPVTQQKCYQIFNDPPRSKPCPECRKNRDFEGKTNCEFTRQVRTGKGFRTLKLKSVPLKDSNGEFHGFLEISEDITDQETREELRKNYTRFLELINRVSAEVVNIPDEEWNNRIHSILRQLGEFFEVDRCCLYTFDAQANLLSNTHEWCAPGISAQMEFLQEVPESALPWWFNQFKALAPIHVPDIMTLPPEASLEKQELMRQEIKSILYLPMRNEAQDCIGYIGFDSVKAPRVWEDNHISMLQIFTSLLTGTVLRKQNRIVILRRESQYRQLVENSLNGVFTLELMCDVDGTPMDLHILNVNPSGAKILNQPRDNLIDSLASNVFPGLADPAVLKQFSRLVRTGKAQTLGMKTVDPVRHLDLTAYPLHGLCFAIVIADNTARELAIAENNALQQQLNHAHKMESIGRLAGGVAHDFNNTLQVILGNSEMALNFQNPSPILKNSLLEIRDAAKRSSTLTRQLLAFARKQTIEPKEVHLNETLLGMIKMLRRLIEEQITLEWKLAEDLWPVFIDPGLIDQLLANLCVNAGDAIPAKGEILIQTENTAIKPSEAVSIPGAKPGEYVKLSVRDTGTGIPQELHEKVFEPFITTKAEGKGTGLGLATVHGIVLQNKGFITLESTMGVGTCFNIYLPRHRSSHHAAPEKPVMQDLRKGSEHVLIVEDEPLILQMTVMTLNKLGYKTLSAASPKAALHLAENPDTPIDLLLTDVVMPEMDGKELSRELTRKCPDLRTLFMSGYPHETMVKYGIAQTENSFIQKPFSVAEISQKLRAVLDHPDS